MRWWFVRRVVVWSFHRLLAFGSHSVTLVISGVSVALSGV